MTLGKTMLKFLKLGVVASTLLFSFAFTEVRMPGIWSNWRGPHQNGISDETGLPSSWSIHGENLVWKALLGGRSAPIFMAGRLYLVNTAAEGELEQEQVVCLDANTGKTIWQYRFNIYGSDVPTHRVGWASPVGDPATERIYVMGVGGTFVCLDRNGKALWEHSLSEEFGLITTHGGRTKSPIVFENLVITGGVSSGWGKQGPGSLRYIACDKLTGEIEWVAQPGGRPYDTTYATSVITEIGGSALLLDGGSDGGIHAMKARTGEKVWHFAFSKRGINTGVVTDGKWVYATHGEENLDTSVMGRVVALDPTLSGDVSKTAEKWRADGLTISYSSPLLVDGRLYVIDNGATLFCLDASNGEHLWEQNLGTIQKASPVYADGKIYVGTANGKFYILKPGDTQCEVLDVDQLSKVAGKEEILASAAIALGRVYLVSTKATYCIGPKTPAAISSSRTEKTESTKPAGAQPAHIQAIPTELVLLPNQAVSFTAKSFDAAGNFIREEAANWTLAGLQGAIGSDGKFSSDKAPQAGEVRATVSGITGAARVRIIPPLPWNEDFQSLALESFPGHWVGVAGRYRVREVDGNKILVKLSNPQAMLRRGRAYMGPSTLSDYTVAADVLGTEKRRQMPDAGVIAQRYALVLHGNFQELSIESWQPETKRTVRVPFEWKPDVWYRLKVRAENTADGKALVRGKAWPKGSPEPDKWLIEKIDPIPNVNGSPGLYSYALNEIYYDNIEVTKNSK